MMIILTIITIIIIIIFIYLFYIHLVSFYSSTPPSLPNTETVILEAYKGIKGFSVWVVPS